MASAVFRPSSAPAGMDNLNSETASAPGGSAISVAFEAARFSSEQAAARPTAPSPAAASSTARREVVSVIVSSADCQPRALAFARAASSRADWPSADPWSLELEHEDGPGLGYDRRGFVDRVEAVLDAACIEVPACGDGDVLLAVDLEGGGHTNHAGGRREAPQFIPRARIERAELPVGRSTREYQISACNQKRRPQHGLEVVLPNTLARIQIPGLKLAKMIGGTRRANRP